MSASISDAPNRNSSASNDPTFSLAFSSLSSTPNINHDNDAIVVGSSHDDNDDDDDDDEVQQPLKGPPASPKRQHRAVITTRYPSMSECDQSIVAASALVGENVLDSPTSRRMTKTFSYEDGDVEYDADDDIVDPEHRNNSNNISESRARSIMDAANVGVIASGWAWVKRQRARRQREYLQHQAEVQLRKIAEAQELEHTGGASSGKQHLHQQQQELPPPTPPLRSGLEQNPIYQQLTRRAGYDPEPPSVEVIDDKDKSTTENILDSSLNGRVKVKSACISKSGLGISVSVEVPLWHDDDDETNHNNTNNAGDWIPEVRLVDDDENLFSYPFVLTHDQMQDIATLVLPLGISHCYWKRLYSLARDGDSFENCLRLVGNEPRSLLVLRTTRGVLLGGFADSPWEMTNQQVSGFHGSAQACLFTFFNNNDINNNNHTITAAATTTSKDDENHNMDPNGPLIVYKWTGANRYFQLVSLERKMLAFGGGGDEGSFGLCVEQDFQLGSTGCCDTFGNQPLCDQENFSIVDMEIWSFVTGRF